MWNHLSNEYLSLVSVCRPSDVQHNVAELRHTAVLSRLTRSASHLERCLVSPSLRLPCCRSEFGQTFGRAADLIGGSDYAIGERNVSEPPSHRPMCESNLDSLADGATQILDGGDRARRRKSIGILT